MSEALPRRPRSRSAEPTYPTLRRVCLGLALGLAPGLARADSGETATPPAQASEEQAWAAVEALLAGLADASDEAPVTLEQGGQPWLESRLLVDVSGAGRVLIALQDDPTALAAMLADPDEYIAENACLLALTEGESRAAVCGQEAIQSAAPEAPCGVALALPFGGGEAEGDALVLYDETIEAFVPFGQAYDFLSGWRMGGCTCATAEISGWSALLVAVVGALRRRRLGTRGQYRSPATLPA